MWLTASRSCPAPQPSSPSSSLYSFTGHLSCVGLNFRRPFLSKKQEPKHLLDSKSPHKASLFHLVPQIVVPRSHTTLSPPCRPTSFLTRCKLREPSWLLAHPADGHRCPFPLQCPPQPSLQEEGRHHYIPRITLMPSCYCLNALVWGCF